MNSSNCIDKDELMDVVSKLDYLQLLTSALFCDFFLECEPKTKAEAWQILSQFKKYRAYSRCIFDTVFEINKHLENLGISAY